MALNQLEAFWILSFSLAMTPGADWAFAISSGMQNKTLIPAVLGMLLGYSAITVIVALGVGAILFGLPFFLAVLTYAGAAYLLWLGVNVLRNPPVPSATNISETMNGLKALTKGFGISGLNPKALLLFLTLMPQFTSLNLAEPVSVQILFMGIIHIINCSFIYSIVGLSSNLYLRTRPVVARKISQLSGVVMIIIAFLLISEQLTREII